MLRHAPLPVALAALLTSACVAEPTFDDMNADYFEGHAYDEGRTDAPPGFDKADRAAPYERPDDLPELIRPEVIVSLEGLTVHLFDRATGFSRVYPTGVGTLGRSGRSITPTGHFATHADTSNGWYYIATRWEPAYFEGYPFIRLNAKNSNGYDTYGLHGPITDPLRRDYVSHGCARMDKESLVELFFLIRSHPSTPVTIQQERELDAQGEPVDVGVDAAVWGVGDDIEFGASVGPRDDSPAGFIGDLCESDEDCGRFEGAEGYRCNSVGYCTIACEGGCPDREGSALTFCAEDWESPGAGVCVPSASAINAQCARLPGTVSWEVDRWLGSSSASEARQLVCIPEPS